jgi:hypothetical protein
MILEKAEDGLMDLRDGFDDLDLAVGRQPFDAGGHDLIIRMLWKKAGSPGSALPARPNPGRHGSTS